MGSLDQKNSDSGKCCTEQCDFLMHVRNPWIVSWRCKNRQRFEPQSLQDLINTSLKQGMLPIPIAWNKLKAKLFSYNARDQLKILRKKEFLTFSSDSSAVT